MSQPLKTAGIVAVLLVGPALGVTAGAGSVSAACSNGVTYTATISVQPIEDYTYETGRGGSCEGNPMFYSGAYRSGDSGDTSWVVYHSTNVGNVTATATQSSAWQNAPTIQDNNRNAPLEMCGPSPFGGNVCEGSWLWHTNTGF